MGSHRTSVMSTLGALLISRYQSNPRNLVKKKLIKPTKTVEAHHQVVEIHVDPDACYLHIFPGWLLMSPSSPLQNTAKVPVFSIRQDKIDDLRKQPLAPIVIPLDSSPPSDSSGSCRSSTAEDDSETDAEDPSDSASHVPTMSVSSYSSSYSSRQQVTVRDFAYIPRHAPIPEIFDQHLAVAEYEIRMREDPRVSPIAGKTLYRLMELGCVTEAEAKERWKSMDWDAYREYKARPGSPYPYNTIRNMSIPKKLKEREKLVKAKTMQITVYDRARVNAIRKEMAMKRTNSEGVIARKPFDVEQVVLSGRPGLTRRMTSGSTAFYFGSDSGDDSDGGSQNTEHSVEGPRLHSLLSEVTTAVAV